MIIEGFINQERKGCLKMYNASFIILWNLMNFEETCSKVLNLANWCLCRLVIECGDLMDERWSKMRIDALHIF